MPTLTGTLSVITGGDLDPTRVRQVVVRAPDKRASLGTSDRLVTTAPARINNVTGVISVDLEPGPALLIVNTMDSNDVYELYVTADMTLLTEAANEAAPAHERSWVESQMVQLRAATVTAAGDAQAAKSDAEGAASVAEGHRTHVDAIRQTLDEAAQNNVAPYLTQSELNATYARKRVVDVRDFGDFSAESTWQANRDALQAANDFVAVYGGGIVALPDGRFFCKGVVQDSHVTIDGPGATLVHPDGQTIDIIRSRVRTTTGSVAAGSATLTVADATGIEPGCLVAVRGAGGQLRLQATTLASAITDSQTDGITLASTTGFANSGLLLIESELIAYTGRSGAALTGVTRGAFGTTAAEHGTAPWIAVAAVHISPVVSVSGTAVTLESPAVGAVTGAPVWVGALAPGFGEITFDGNRVPGGSSSTVNPWRWDLARWGTWGHVHVENAECAHYFSQGTSDCRGNLVTARNCSVPEGSKGAVGWYFQRCSRNRAERYEIYDGVWSGVYYDNRTSLATEWDGPCSNNSIGTLKIKTTYLGSGHTNTGFIVVGGDNNVVENLDLDGVRTGFLFENHTQVYNPTNELPSTTGNRVLSGNHRNGYQPWIMETPGNMAMGFTYSTAANGSNPGGSLALGCSPTTGAAPILGRFPDGVQSAPGMAFEQETNTGFYRIAPGQIQFVALGQLGIRLRSTGVLWADGKNLEFGSAAGTKIGGAAAQKMGFWGATPVAQPTGITTTTGLSLAALEEEVNKLKVLLRTVGLAGS